LFKQLVTLVRVLSFAGVAAKIGQGSKSPVDQIGLHLAGAFHHAEKREGRYQAGRECRDLSIKNRGFN